MVEIDWYDKLLCMIVRKLHKSNRITKSLEKHSHKKYGYRDDVSRYYVKKYVGIDIGEYSYGWKSLEFGLLKSVGRYTSIAAGVKLVPNTHKIEYVTTSPILSHKMFGFIDRDVINEYAPNFENSVEIGNDVWIGANSIIFNNVKIGDGAIIAANSVVRKDVPPYAIVGSVDKIIKYRFDEETIKKLLEIKWWDWNPNQIKSNIDLLYNPELLIDAYDKGAI